MSIDDIFVVGNSWSIPSVEAPNPAFTLLNLNNRWEHPGITLDVQSEYIIKNKLVKAFKVIWLIGHHHRADPKGNGDYLVPYDWGEGNIWGKMTRDIWFKKFTEFLKMSKQQFDGSKCRAEVIENFVDFQMIHISKSCFIICS